MVDDKELFSNGRVTTRDVNGINFERQFGDKTKHKVEINPEESRYINFRRGYRVVYCSHELDVKDKIRLYLNKVMGVVEGDLLYIETNGLKKIVNSWFPFVYHKVHDGVHCIKARESAWGELELKIRKKEAGLKFKSKVVFSRKEYDILKEYVDALNLS